MRVQRIDLYSNDLEVARFDTAGPNRRNPYVLRSVAGLDPGQITPRFYGQGIETGINFTELALDPREVVMRIGLQPKWTIGNTPADLRDNLLGAIASNRSGLVQLRIYENEVVIGLLEGFIIKFEDTISSKEAEVTLTIKCEDPIIRSMDVTSAIIATLGSPPTIIDPISTAPHGMKMKVTFTADSTNFVIAPPGGSPDWSFELNYAFLTGDELYISSEYNDKYVYRVRSAVTLHLTDTLEPGSHWPLIFRGENQFSLVDSADITINEWYWREAHWGI